MKQIVFGSISVTTDNSSENWDTMIEQIKKLIDYDNEVKIEENKKQCKCGKED